MRRCSVLVMESDHLVWRGLAEILESMADLQVVARATCAGSARSFGTMYRPEAILAATAVGEARMAPVLIDLQRGPCLATKIVLFSDSVEAIDGSAMAGLRYHAWLAWPELTWDGLPHLLRAALLADGRVATRSVVAALLGSGNRQRPAGTPPEGGTIRLSNQERAVLELLAVDGNRELALKEIGSHLGIKTATVATYVERLGIKLGVRQGGRRAIVNEARRSGLVS